MFTILEAKAIKYRPSSKKELEEDADLRFRKIRPIICVTLIHNQSPVSEDMPRWRVTACRKTVSGESYWSYRIHSPHDSSKTGGCEFLQDRLLEKLTETFRSATLAEEIKNTINDKLMELLEEAPQHAPTITPEQARDLIRRICAS